MFRLCFELRDTVNLTFSGKLYIIVMFYYGQNNVISHEEIQVNLTNDHSL